MLRCALPYLSMCACVSRLCMPYNYMCTCAYTCICIRACMCMYVNSWCTVLHVHACQSVLRPYMIVCGLYFMLGLQLESLCVVRNFFLFTLQVLDDLP